MGVSHYLAILCLLLIGSLVRFSGTAFTDCYQLESLTDCFTLHMNPHKNAMNTQLAQAFGALKIAAESLHNYYKVLNMMKMDEL